MLLPKSFSELGSASSSSKIAAGAVVENSMVTDGCQIKGTVRHSILFEGVKVEKGAIIEDAVIMGQKESMPSNGY